MTAKTIGKHLGIGDRRVRQILEAAGVKPVKHGHFDPIEALAAHARYFRSLSERNIDSYAAERALLCKARREKAELEIDEMRKRFYLAAEVRESFRMVAVTTRAILQRKLESEMPEKLQGLSAPDIREILKSVVDDICKTHQTHDFYEKQKNQTDTESQPMAGRNETRGPGNHHENLRKGMEAD